jgi:hypothetical protein
MTFLKIRKRIAEEMGVAYDDTSTDANDTMATKIKEWINNRYAYLAGRRSWNWLITDQIIQTSAQITTGTVTATLANTTITFSSAPAVSVAGWWIQFSDSKDWYIISTHTAGVATAVLTKAYLGTTSSTLTYTLRKVYYALPSNVHKIMNLRQTRDNTTLRYLPPRIFDRCAADRTRVSNPLFYTVLGLDSSNLYRMEFYPVPVVAMNVAMRAYVVPTALSADGDVPLTPEAYHEYLVWDVLATYAYTHEDDTRRKQAQDIRDEIYAAMLANDTAGENIPQRAPFDVDLGSSSTGWLSQIRLPIQ